MLVNLRTAVKALARNRLQSALTLSGMAIGVAMVLLVAGLGRGAQERIEDAIERAGPTRITIRAGNFQPAGIAAAGFEEGSGGEQSEGAIGGGDGSGEPTYLDPATVRAALERRERLRDRARIRKNFRSPAAPLTQEQIDGLKESVTEMRAIVGSIEGNISLDTALNNRVRVVRLHGFQAPWPDMGGWRLLEGRFLTDSEHKTAAPVAVLPTAVAQRLWPADTALGQTFAIGDQRVEVVGVIETQDTAGGFLLVPDVFVPLALAQRLLSREDLDRVEVRSTSVAHTSAVAKQISAELRRLRALPDDTFDDFRVETQSTAAMPGLGTDPRLALAVKSNVVEFEQEAWEEMAGSLRRAGRTFTLLLTGAAAVSLLVGGIGVMNVMLVSVTARTREIGLRMAMGARVGDVLTQFLVEAVTLACLGGAIGLLFGSFGLWIANRGLNWATAISADMLLLGIAVAATTGIVFGYGPAHRAARLDPVVALRSE